MKACIFLLAILLLAVHSIPLASDTPSSLWGDLQSGSYSVGFRLIEDFDSARAIQVDDSTASVGPCPVRVYLWYPAKAVADEKLMLFGRYVELANADVWPDSVLGRAREQMLFGHRPLARSLPASRFGTVSEESVHAVENAIPYLVLLEDMGHAGFTSYALIEDREPVMGYWGPVGSGVKHRYEAIGQHVSRFFRAYLADDSESRSFLALDPGQTVPGTTLTIEYRAAVAPPPSYSSFRNAILAGNTAAAREMARSIRETPDNPILQEPVLDQLGYSILLSWDLKDEAIAVFSLNLELHPQSIHANESLGQG